MTKTRSRIVNRERLNRLGISMELEKLLVSNLTSPVIPPNLYGNALEALIGALFIDKGYKRTRDFFIGKVLKKHLNLSEVLESVTDYKSMVLEYCQKNRFKLNFIPAAMNAAENSPPLFSIRLEINDMTVAEGEGATKKEAEQDASMAAWGKIMSEKI
jgi:ribonuclease-3